MTLNKILYEIYALIKPSGYSWFRPKHPKKKEISEEDTLALLTAALIRSKFLEGKLNCVVFKVPNESAVDCKNKKGRINLKTLLLKDTLRIPGVSDLVFINNKCTLFLELKGESGKLSPKQVLFSKWCELMDLEYKVCRNVQEIEKLLLSRELIR